MLAAGSVTSTAWAPAEERSGEVRLPARLPAPAVSRSWTATWDGLDTGLAKNPTTLKRMGNDMRGIKSAVIMVLLSLLRSSSSLLAISLMVLARDAGIAPHHVDEDLLQAMGLRELLQ